MTSPRTIPMVGDASVRTQFNRPICSGGFHRSLSRFTQKVSRPSRPGSDNSPATADRHHVAGSKPRNDIFSSRVQNAARPESDDAMTDRPAIFVSATSGEFRSFRLALKRQLERKGVLMIVQDEFPTDYGEVREMLASRIRESDAVICLVGFRLWRRTAAAARRWAAPILHPTGI